MGWLIRLSFLIQTSMNMSFKSAVIHLPETILNESILKSLTIPVNRITDFLLFAIDIWPSCLIKKVPIMIAALAQSRPLRTESLPQILVMLLSS